MRWSFLLWLISNKAMECIREVSYVSAIFEKSDEQGGEDCLSNSRFSNLLIPGTFAGIS